MNHGLLRAMQALASRLPIRVLAPQEVLFHAGHHGDSFFCVLSGEIELRFDNTSVHRFGAGEVVDVGGLFGQAHQRLGTASACCAVELIEIDRAHFLFVVQELPTFALELMASYESQFQDQWP